MTRTDSSGTNTMLPDGLNSTLGPVNSGGSLATQFSYEPFGRTTFSGSGTSNLYRFAGRELDATGLYFMRARYYNPILQRFLSPDIGGGDPSPYTYAHNNPMNFIDPLGTEAIGPFGNITTGALIGLGSAGDPNLAAAPGFGAAGGSMAGPGAGVVADAGVGGGDTTGLDNSSADSSGQAGDMGGSGGMSGIPGIPEYLAQGNGGSVPDVAPVDSSGLAAPAAFAGAIAIYGGGVSGGGLILVKAKPTAAPTGTPALPQLLIPNEPFPEHMPQAPVPLNPPYEGPPLKFAPRLPPPEPPPEYLHLQTTLNGPY